MEIQMVSLDDIKPYQRNAKKHDQMQIDNVAESIKQYGFVQPIVIDRDGVIVIGHCRAIAAKNIGFKELPCIRVDDLTPEQVNALRIIDNKSNESPWDIDFLTEELAKIDLTGFTFEFGLELPQIVEAISLDDETDVPNDENQKQQVHCPKCGFVFEV